MKHARHVVEAFALGLLVAAVALAAVIVARGTRTVTKPLISAVVPQQAPAAKVVAHASVPPATKAQDVLPCPPPAGEGYLGACTPKPVIALGASTVVPAKVDPPASLPDVSSWQGHPDWRAVVSWQRSHGFAPGGIFKIGEYGVDPDAAYNNASLKSLGAFRMGYWFVRNTGCKTEASQIISEAHTLGLTIVGEDVEVPEARGYPPCLTPKLKAAGLTAVVYTAPGTWTGDALSSTVDSWMAAYGPVVPRTPWGGSIKAWQCTDGVFGCVTYVPGIGKSDVSIDYGITKLGVKLPPLCSRTMCLSRFGSHRLSGGRRAGLVYGKSICQHGCDERQLVGWWQTAQKSTHAHRLWIRYRLQHIYQHLEALIHASSRTANAKAERGLRAHVVWAIAYQAQSRHDFNDYLKVH